MARTYGVRQGQPEPERTTSGTTTTTQGGSGRPTRGGGSSGQGRAAGARTPLGVDADYVATSQRRYGTNWAYPYVLSRPMRPGSAYEETEIGPRYFEGDEMKPGHMWDTERIIEAQRRMIIAGFLDPDSGFGLGSWDPKTFEAYADLLSYANRMGMDADSALRHRARMVGQVGGETGNWRFDPETGQFIPLEDPGFVAPALQARVTHPDDLRAVFRQAVIGALGQGWSQREIDELVEAFQWKEIQVQADAHGRMVERERQLFETGATDIEQITEVERPDPGAFIDEEARRRDPAGYQATQLAEDFAPVFFDSLGGYV